MKNYEKYPNQPWPDTKDEYFEFWKDCPYVQDTSVPELTRYQWCIIMFTRWWLSGSSKEELYKN